MKLLDIFEDIISKCPDIIRKNTPLPAHSLDSSRSIELKLLVNHYETPCMKRGPMKSRCINVYGEVEPEFGNYQLISIFNLV